MSRPPLEVADLIRAAGAAFIERNRSWIRWKHVKVLLAIEEGDQPMVGDGHAMGVTAEILQHIFGATEGAFLVDHPVFSVEWS